MKLKQYIIPVSALLVVAIIFVLSLFSERNKEFTASGFAMGSPVSITVYDKHDGDEIGEDTIYKIQELDKDYLSHTNEDSLVYKLNTEKNVEADEWFSEYINTCLDLSVKNDKFTLFSGEMKELWQVENGGYVPTDEEITVTLDSLQKSSLKVENNKITLNNGILDLGALGKGTACDVAVEYMKFRGAENAVVSVGGTVGAIGRPDGSKDFNIGVRNPFGGQNDYFAILSVTDCFVSTSGDYEKYFEKDGVRYSHIFDATTGKPVQNDITAVTVVADNGTLSDYLSTLIFIEGVDKGFQIAKENNAQILIIKKDKSVLISEGLEDKLTIKDSSFSVSVVE